MARPRPSLPPPVREAPFVGGSSSLVPPPPDGRPHFLRFSAEDVDEMREMVAVAPSEEGQWLGADTELADEYLTDDPMAFRGGQEEGRSRLRHDASWIQKEKDYETESDADKNLRGVEDVRTVPVAPHVDAPVIESRIDVASPKGQVAAAAPCSPRPLSLGVEAAAVRSEEALALPLDEGDAVSPEEELAGEDGGLAGEATCGGLHGCGKDQGTPASDVVIGPDDVDPECVPTKAELSCLASRAPSRRGSTSGAQIRHGIADSAMHVVCRVLRGRGHGKSLDAERIRRNALRGVFDALQEDDIIGRPEQRHNTEEFWHIFEFALCNMVPILATATLIEELEVIAPSLEPQAPLLDRTSVPAPARAVRGRARGGGRGGKRGRGSRGAGRGGGLAAQR